MSRQRDCCKYCGRLRGDGRRDKGWRYEYADLPKTKLTLLLCFCPECAVELDREADLREAARAEDPS